MRRPFTPPVALAGPLLRSAAPLKTGLRGLLLAIPILGVGCSAPRMPETPDGIRPLREKLTITPSQPWLAIRPHSVSGTRLTASAREAGVQIVEPVRWVSSRPDVVSVEESDGTWVTVRGLTEGFSTITATSANGLVGTTVVRVG